MLKINDKYGWTKSKYEAIGIKAFALLENSGA
jgi:hypothetical protein